MTQKLKIVFFDTKQYDKTGFLKANESFGYDFLFLETRLTAESAWLAKDADAVCAFVNDSINADVISILVENNVRLIALRCAGYNNVDLKAAWKQLHITRVPAYSPYAIAEHAAALLLMLTRNLQHSYNRVREGNFLLSGLVGRDLHGKFAGIAGTGKIGKIAAQIFRGFGMRILVHDKFPDKPWALELGVEYVDFNTLCTLSDVISLHAPLSPETHHIINERTLALMKPDAVIINTGRGALIDTRALVNALKKRAIGGAGLDVYEEEEGYFFEDWSTTAIEDDVLARLLTFPNVVITGHQAFLTAEALNAIAQTTLENIRLFFEKQILPNEICYKCEAGACTKEIKTRCW